MFKSLWNTVRGEWTRMLLELVVVVLGISISFAFQDWRQDRDDRSEERRLLESFATELRMDHRELELRSELLDASIERIGRALDPQSRPALDAAALDLVMDGALGYQTFSPSTATYQELRQTGSSALLRDKRLAHELIALYERAYKHAAEWDEINRSFVLERMFAFVDDHGPAFESATDNAFAQGYHAAFEQLEGDPRFRNLLRSGTLFMKGQRQVYALLTTRTAQLLEQLDAEL